MENRSPESRREREWLLDAYQPGQTGDDCISTAAWSCDMAGKAGQGVAGLNS
jgi:hypothetical protein